MIVIELAQNIAGIRDNVSRYGESKYSDGRNPTITAQVRIAI